MSLHASCATKTLQQKICVDCSATSIFLSYGLLLINHYFPLCENFKVATVAWYYPRLLSSPFFFFLGGYLNLCPPSLIPLSQSMTPSKGWQNKERPLSITLSCAEMSSGLCLLKLRGASWVVMGHNSWSVGPPKINGSQHTSFSCLFFFSVLLRFLTNKTAIDHCQHCINFSTPVSFTVQNSWWLRKTLIPSRILSFKTPTLQKLNFPLPIQTMTAYIPLWPDAPSELFSLLYQIQP